MTNQQMIDRKLITDIWYLLRDFGDITNGDQDVDRWVQVNDINEDLQRKYPADYKMLIVDAITMLEARAMNRNREEVTA